MSKAEDPISYDNIYKNDNPPAETNGWIQWKGTRVCMDIHCVCGYHSHMDVEYFFYHFRCAGCNRHYAVGQNVKLIPFNDTQVRLLKKNDSRGFYHDDTDLEDFNPSYVPPPPHD